jgi:transposase
MFSIRHAFAKAKGQRAKTDVIDAVMIALFTAQLGDTPAKQVDPEREALADLVRLRRLLVDKRADLEKARLPADAAALVDPALEALRTAIAAVNARLEQTVQANRTVVVQALQSAPGAITALAVLVPEQISGAQAAALLGRTPTTAARQTPDQRRAGRCPPRLVYGNPDGGLPRQWRAGPLLCPADRGGQAGGPDRLHAQADRPPQRHARP